MLNRDEMASISCTRIGGLPVLKLAHEEVGKVRKRDGIPKDDGLAKICLMCTKKKCSGSNECVKRRKEEMETGEKDASE